MSLCRHCGLEHWEGCDATDCREHRIGVLENEVTERDAALDLLRTELRNEQEGWDCRATDCTREDCRYHAITRALARSAYPDKLLKEAKGEAAAQALEQYAMSYGHPPGDCQNCDLCTAARLARERAQEIRRSTT